MNRNLFANYPDILKIEDIMEILHIGKSIAYQLLRNNEIKNRKVARKYLVSKNDLITYCNVLFGEV